MVRSPRFPPEAPRCSPRQGWGLGAAEEDLGLFGIRSPNWQPQGALLLLHRGRSARWAVSAKVLGTLRGSTRLLRGCSGRDMGAGSAGCVSKAGLLAVMHGVVPALVCLPSFPCRAPSSPRWPLTHSAVTPLTSESWGLFLVLVFWSTLGPVTESAEWETGRVWARGGQWHLRAWGKTC